MDRGRPVSHGGRVQDQVVIGLGGGSRDEQVSDAAVEDDLGRYPGSRCTRRRSSAGALRQPPPGGGPRSGGDAGALRPPSARCPRPAAAVPPRARASPCPLLAAVPDPPGRGAARTAERSGGGGRWPVRRRRRRGSGAGWPGRRRCPGGGCRRVRRASVVPALLVVFVLPSRPRVRTQRRRSRLAAPCLLPRGGSGSPVRRQGGSIRWRLRRPWSWPAAVLAVRAHGGLPPLSWHTGRSPSGAVARGPWPVARPRGCRVLTAKRGRAFPGCLDRSARPASERRTPTCTATGHRGDERPAPGRRARASGAGRCVSDPSAGSASCPSCALPRLPGPRIAATIWKGARMCPNANQRWKQP